MKIYLSKINESWIVDRVREEWYEFNKEISTDKIKEADIIWIIAPWVWKKIPKKHLKNKKLFVPITTLILINLIQKSVKIFLNLTNMSMNIMLFQN